MDDESIGGPDDTADAASLHAEQRAEDEIIDLPWDDELPVALGEEITVEASRSPAPAGEVSSAAAPPEEADEAHPDGEADAGDSGEDMGELYEDDHVAGRRNALPRRVESWRSRSATGAIATAIAMGLQQVFEPERRRPAAVAEAPSDPYDDDDPVTVEYVPDDAEATTVHVKPWLLQKGEPG